jgi:argininosuccinate lyase
VRRASAAGLHGTQIDGALLDSCAADLTGRPLGLTGRDLTSVLDPERIVAGRAALGGAAPGEVTRMAAEVAARAGELAAQAREWRDSYQAAAVALVGTARRCLSAATDHEFRDVAGAAARPARQPEAP